MVAGVLTILAYVLVIGTFLDVIPGYPDIGLETSTLLSHAIAAINTATIVALSLGWVAIRRNEIERHQRAMLTAFVLIVLFLVLYLLRVGGGAMKVFDGPAMATTVYRAMLGIHILLSIVAVPLVAYVLTLGLSFSPTELMKTNHARVGRFAAASWLLSLILGVVAYLMLEHLYGWEWASVIILPIAW